MWEKLIQSCPIYVALSGLHAWDPIFLVGKRDSHLSHGERGIPFTKVGFSRFANMAYNLAIIMSLAPNLDLLHQSILNLRSKLIL